MTSTKCLDHDLASSGSDADRADRSGRLPVVGPPGVLLAGGRRLRLRIGAANR